MRRFAVLLIGAFFLATPLWAQSSDVVSGDFGQQIDSSDDGPTPSGKVGVRLYGGAGFGKQQLSTHGYGDESFTASGFQLYTLVGIWKGLSALGSVGYLDGGLSSSGPMIASADLGVAYAWPFDFIMPWAGIKYGLAVASWDDETYRNSEFTIDIGADFRLGRLLLGILYQAEATSFDFMSSATTDTASNSIWLMAGVRF